jgi:hypothetical protein
MKDERNGSVNDNAQRNNNIATKNITISKILPVTSELGSPAFPTTMTTPHTATIVVKGDTTLPNRSSCLKFATTATLMHEAEIRVRLDDVLYNVWVRGGMQSGDVVYIGNQTFLLTGATARMENLLFEPHEWGFLTVGFNFLTQKITADQTTFDLHLVQMNCNTPRVIGGEVFHIIKSPRTPFYAVAAATVCPDANIYLKAEEIGEEAIYNWYDQNGNLICNERECYVDGKGGHTYKLEVIALSDGYKDYAEATIPVQVESCGRIESLFPNPTFGDIAIHCKLNSAVTNASIEIANYMGMIYAVYTLTPDISTVKINTETYPTGTYVVKLRCGSEVVDSKTFVKE